MRTFIILCTLSLVLGTTPSLQAASQNIVTNGDFELGLFASPGDPNYAIWEPGFVGTIIHPGSAILLGWDVAISPFDPDQSLSSELPNGLEWTRLLHENNRVIDLNRGGDLWSISQQLSTVIGQQYQLSYDLQPGSVMGGATVRFSIAGTNVQAFESTSSIMDSPLWENHTHRFIADASTTILNITATAIGLDPASGPQIDNVKIIAIPEPATGTLLLLGLAWLGRRVRRSPDDKRGRAGTGSDLADRRRGGMAIGETRDMGFRCLG